NDNTRQSNEVRAGEIRPHCNKTVMKRHTSDPRESDSHEYAHLWCMFNKTTYSDRSRCKSLFSKCLNRDGGIGTRDRLNLIDLERCPSLRPQGSSHSRRERR